MSIAKCLQDLETHGLANRGTELGALLQWAKLHIEELTGALAEREIEADTALAQNRHMHSELIGLMELLAQVQTQARKVAPVEPFATLSRDMTSHINVMMAHGVAPYAKTKRTKKAITA